MDIYFWRQFLVLLCIILHSMIDGISVTIAGVMNSSILSPNTADVRATPSQASWIAAAPGFGAFPGVFVAGFLIENIGRKYTHVTVVFFDLLSWIVLTFANDTTTLFITRLIRGFGEGLFIDGILISEYVNPKRRGYFIAMRKLGLGLGSLVCHTMSLYCKWRKISVFAAVLLLISLILTLTWKESPAYCAMKGKFKECEENFQWLHENTEERRQELEHLMAAQMIRLEKVKTKNKIKTLLKAFLEKGFFKALLISTLLTLIIDLCGRYYYFAYMKQIFLMITGDESFANYCPIINDFLTIAGLAISCFSIRCFKRRTLVFRFGILTALLMFAISLSDFLKIKHGIGLQQQWLVPGLLLLLNFVSNLGVVPINFSVASELFPLEFRGIGTVVSTLIIFTLYILSMKCISQILNLIGLFGTYGTFGIGILICLSILYFVLPETKDRTMQEIGDEINNVDKSVVETRVMILKEKLQVSEVESEVNELLLKETSK